jgi:hypothetical protein
MLTRLFRKRGTGQGPVVESTPDPFDFNKPLTGQARIDNEKRKASIDQDRIETNNSRDNMARGKARDAQIAKESTGPRYKTPTELERQ